MNETDEIKRNHCEMLIAAEQVIAIARTAEGYEIHQWTTDSVMPTVGYPTARLAASRMLQLLGIGPVAPQTHPETIGIEIAVAEEPRNG